MTGSRLRILIALLALLPASFLISSDLGAQSPEELERRWKKKQESSFLKAVKWGALPRLCGGKSAQGQSAHRGLLHRSYAP